MPNPTEPTDPQAPPHPQAPTDEFDPAFGPALAADSPDTGWETLLEGTPDLPLILAEFQDQLDHLHATVRLLQDQVSRQAARLTALEHR